MLLALAAALLAFGLLSARDGLTSGTFKLDGRVSASHISFDGSCNAGTIASDSPTIPASGGLGTGLVIKTTGTVFGCMATECFPDNLIMDGELFTYSNISAATITQITDGSWNNQDLYVENLLATDTCAAQNHFPNEFPSSGYIFVGSEQLQYDSRDSNKFHIIGRGAEPTGHATGSLVRARNLLKLKARAVPRYIGGPPTTEAAHGVGTTVSSPQVYTNCRALLLAPMGTAQVGSRSRCYFVLEPGYNPSTCPGTPASCYWPDAAIPIEDGGMPITALQPLHPVIYHDISEGTLTDFGTTALLSLRTQVAGVNCFTQIEGQLWVQVLTDTTLDTNFTDGDEDDGEFQIRAFTNPTCTLPAAIVLGGPNDLTSIQLSASHDTDGDSCPDAKELRLGQGTGGSRDPFNHYDYFNTAGNAHQIRVDDILKVVHQFFKDDADSTPGRYPYVAGYEPETDRTPLGPDAWNLGKPNGQQRVDDILAEVKQFFHDC
jgi:hypothetical protein